MFAVQLRENIFMENYKFKMYVQIIKLLELEKKLNFLFKM